MTYEKRVYELGKSDESHVGDEQASMPPEKEYTKTQIDNSIAVHEKTELINPQFFVNNSSSIFSKVFFALSFPVIR